MCKIRFEGVERVHFKHTMPFEMKEISDIPSALYYCPHLFMLYIFERWMIVVKMFSSFCNTIYNDISNRNYSNMKMLYRHITCLFQSEAGNISMAKKKRSQFTLTNN